MSAISTLAKALSTVVLIYSAFSGLATVLPVIYLRSDAGRSSRVLSRSRMRETELRSLEH